MTVTVFGTKEENVEYKARYGVHAIVHRDSDDKYCIIQAPNGAYFLPGGEIEAGETHEEALKRELIEEIGATCEVGEFLGQADEYFYSSHRDQHYYNPAYIYIAKNLDFSQAPLEDFNKVAWFDFDETLAKLKRGSHKWGLEKYKEFLNK